MDPQRQIIDWLQQDDARMAALRTVRRLGLNDWCLGAGFVRNLVWDRRHGYVDATPLNDIDVIHFDAQRADAERDRMLETRLHQCRGLGRSRIRRACTCAVAGRLTATAKRPSALDRSGNGDRRASERRRQHHAGGPFGLAALFDDTITFNVKNGDRAAYAQRVLDKGWLQRWPHLRQVKI